MKGIVVHKTKDKTHDETSIQNSQVIQTYPWQRKEASLDHSHLNHQKIFHPAPVSHHGAAKEILCK